MSYEFLIEMGWKSALIAGAALGLAALLRSRSAADRGAVLKVAVALLLALPLIALFGPALEIAAGTAPATPVLSAADAMATVPVDLATDAPAAASSWDDPSLLFFLLYAGGVAMVVGRLLAGLLTLRRWTRAAREVECPAWRDALARSGGDALGIRLLVSDDARSPLSWGFRRPVVLLDRDTLRAPEEAEAILAHEVAHVARRDWPALILSRTAVALFWFNPLVWRLDREVAQQAEEAADSEAAAKVAPARYAQTLLDWARLGEGPALPANAIAGERGLSRRVKAILDGRVARPSGSGWAVAAALGCVASAAPVATLEFVADAREAPIAPTAPATAPAAPSPVAARRVPSAVLRVPGAPSAPHAAPTAPMTLALAQAGGAPPAPPTAVALPEPAAAPEPMVDGDEIAAGVEAAVAEVGRTIEAATSHAAAAAQHAAEAARAGMARGAEGMMRGADGMERGAARMQAEAAGCAAMPATASRKFARRRRAAGI
ncbi:MAG TPA: M56 family metallopeptidase [Allosphingosinicella sp.]|nr:M56 family metallopeptidase [Allosphingosinicella sp.]